MRREADSDQPSFATFWSKQTCWKSESVSERSTLPFFVPAHNKLPPRELIPRALLSRMSIFRQCTLSRVLLLACVTRSIRPCSDVSKKRQTKPLWVLDYRIRLDWVAKARRRIWVVARIASVTEFIYLDAKVFLKRKFSPCFSSGRFDVSVVMLDFSDGP